MGLARANRLGGRLADMGRRVEIGLADLEVDDVPALALEHFGLREDAEGCLRAEPFEARGEGGCRGRTHEGASITAELRPTLPRFEPRGAAPR